MAVKSMGKTYWEKLKDPRWQKRRLEALQVAEFRCMNCDDDTSTLHVHHNWYVKGRDPWDYDLGEMTVLCETCHANITEMHEEMARQLARTQCVFVGQILGYIIGLGLDECPLAETDRLDGDTLVGISHAVHLKEDVIIKLVQKRVWPDGKTTHYLSGDAIWRFKQRLHSIVEGKLRADQSWLSSSL